MIAPVPKLPRSVLPADAPLEGVGNGASNELFTKRAVARVTAGWDPFEVWRTRVFRRYNKDRGNT